MPENPFKGINKDAAQFYELVKNINKFSQSTAQTWKDLGEQLKHRHEGFLDILASSIKLPGPFKEIAQAFTR